MLSICFCNLVIKFVNAYSLVNRFYKTDRWEDSRGESYKRGAVLVRSYLAPLSCPCCRADNTNAQGGHVAVPFQKFFLSESSLPWGKIRLIFSL